MTLRIQSTNTTPESYFQTKNDADFILFFLPPSADFIFIFSLSDNKKLEDLSDSKTGKAFVLHGAYSGLIAGIPYASQR